MTGGNTNHYTTADAGRATSDPVYAECVIVAVAPQQPMVARLPRYEAHSETYSGGHKACASRIGDRSIPHHVLRHLPKSIQEEPSQTFLKVREDTSQECPGSSRIPRGKLSKARCKAPATSVPEKFPITIRPAMPCSLFSETQATRASLLPLTSCEKLPTTFQKN